MAKKIKAFGTVAEMDLGGLADINSYIPEESIADPAEPVKEKEVAQPRTAREKPIKTLQEKTKEITNPATKDKSGKKEYLNINFKTDKDQRDKFLRLMAKYHMVKEPEKRLKLSEMFSRVILAMAYKTEKIIEATDSDIEFYKITHTKGKNSNDLFIMGEKKSLNILLTKEIYDLTYNLMNTFFHKLEKKPERFSVNFFFFVIVDFFEEHFKII